MKLADLNLAKYNPRTMPAQTMRSLKASLVKHGMVLNLVAQRASPKHGPMILIGGHQRVVAMRELCAERGWAEPAELPVIVLDVGDAAAKQLNVALNNIEGEFDPFKLGEIFADIRGEMTVDDLLATGFAADEIDEMIKLTLPVDEQAALLEADADLGAFARSITLSVEFDTAEARDAAKEQLRSLAAAEGRGAGAVVAEALRAYAAVKRPAGKRAAAKRAG
jgi:ParB-like chromosome segregation protein Spo0J